DNMHPHLKKIQNSYTALEDFLDKKITPNSRKTIKFCLLILFVIAFIPEVYVIPYYVVIVQPGGEFEINQVLEKAQSLNTTEAKVNIISDWEEQNFTNIYGVKPNFSLDFGDFLLYGDGRYPIYFNASNQQPIKIRAFISPFTNDPNWITYFHCGACGELATLFNYISNQGHIESRMVQTTGEDHAWVEVKINNSWTYFDPTLVEIFQRNPDYRSKWFGDPKNFEGIWSWNISRVTVVSTNEDLTSEYTQPVSVTVLLNSSNLMSVSKYDNGKKTWIDLFFRVITSSGNQTAESIQLGESNRYKIRATNFGSGYIPIPKFQEQEFFPNSTENMSMSLNPDNGSYDIPLFVGIIVIIGGFLVLIWGIIRKLHGLVLKRRKIREIKLNENTET
ncbi:transglutaminase domain-containing protein, partial [Methanoregula sp.]|uniref:transglutaminase domain-containing protein n=1 Tax=Methanoregula sp. TaxID=2052170 RepID=UPI003C74157A